MQSLAHGTFLLPDRTTAGGGRPMAVTPARITVLSLPTAPPKTTDRRSFEGETVQAEAIPAGHAGGDPSATPSKSALNTTSMKQCWRKNRPCAA